MVDNQIDQGLPFQDAAVEASKLTLRPIFMIFIAFILEVLALVIATDAGEKYAGYNFNLT